MPRKNRDSHFPGAIFHAIIRGNNRQNIFFSTEDRHHFYRLLEEGSSRFKYKIHAFCLMTNHVHLLLEVTEVPLAKVMQNLTFRYAQHVNKKLNRVGHLFQGRYKAIFVQNQNYLLELCRYIHFNPLKANMVENLTQYPWSSHRAYLGIESISWLTIDYILSLIPQVLTQQMTYQKFMENELNENDKEKSFLFSEKGELIINDKIILKYQAILAQEFPKLELSTIINIVSEHLQIGKDKILSKCMQHSASRARTLIAIFSQQFTDLSLKELAQTLNKEASTLSHAIYRWQIQGKNSSKNLEIYEKIREEIIKVSKLQA